MNIGEQYQLNSTGQRLGNSTINMVNIPVLGANRSSGDPVPHNTTHPLSLLLVPFIVIVNKLPTKNDKKN
jgi:hypothetical protein